jgi:hypothetical protein
LDRYLGVQKKSTSSVVKSGWQKFEMAPSKHTRGRTHLEVLEDRVQEETRRKRHSLQIKKEINLPRRRLTRFILYVKMYKSSPRIPPQKRSSLPRRSGSALKTRQTRHAKKAFVLHPKNFTTESATTVVHPDATLHFPSLALKRRHQGARASLSGNKVAETCNAVAREEFRSALTKWYPKQIRVTELTLEPLRPLAFRVARLLLTVLTFIAEANFSTEEGRPTDKTVGPPVRYRAASSL